MKTSTRSKASRLSFGTAAMLASFSIAAVQTASGQSPVTGYASVNGLDVYYEIHGEKNNQPPLVLLHGAFGTAEGWGHIMPQLAKSRQVIVIEQQGHGHTADRDEPLSFDKMADDTAELLKGINVEGADVFGYSDGGVVGLRLAVTSPDLVRRLAILGSNAGSLEKTYERETYEQFLNLPADFAPPVLREPYDRVAPDPSHWPVLVKKIIALGRDFPGYRDEEIASIQAPTLIMQGDRDVVLPEHAVEMMRLIPNSQLAIFPKADHFVLYTNPDLVVETIMTFFDASADSTGEPSN